MSKLAYLRGKHTELTNNANHLLAEKGDQVWTTEDQAKFDSIMDEADRCKSQIQAHLRAVEQDVEDNFKDIDDFKLDDKSKISDAKKAMDVFMRKQVRELSNDDVLLIRNTMSTTTGSEGGYTVPSEIASQLIDYIKDYGGMRREASQQTTSNGHPISWPTSDGTSEIGEWVAQNASAASADIVFGTVALNVFKAGSKVIAVPIELLQDSIIDIQSLVFKRMASRIGRLANQGYTTGTGTGQPNGVITASSVAKVGTTGQTTTVIYDDLVDLVDAIDIGYFMAGLKPCFMFNQTTRKVIRKIKDTAGRPIWTPSYDTGIIGAVPEQLLGYDVCINNDIASPAANAKSIAFGDFSKYLIRDALDVSIFRFDDSAYMSKGQVGFLAWARTGGNLLDTNAVKLYQHSAT